MDIEDFLKIEPDMKLKLLTQVYSVNCIGKSNYYRIYEGYVATFNDGRLAGWKHLIKTNRPVSPIFPTSGTIPN